MSDSAKTSRIRILLVDDDKSSCESCETSADVYSDDHDEVSIEILCAESISEAQRIMGDFIIDAIILDMRLENGRIEDGQEVLKIVKSNHRVPIAIHSGTPSSELGERNIKVFTRGNTNYSDIFDHLIELKKSPLYSVVGHGGKLDEHLRCIFWERLANNDEFVREDGTHVEGIDYDFILRQATVHLQALVTQTDGLQNPLDMYYMPFNPSINTGTILRAKSLDVGQELSVVLSPPCDLVKRKSGAIKTPCVLTCAIVPVKVFYERYMREPSDSKKGIRGKLNDLAKNEYSPCVHWLYPTGDYESSVIDFRDVSSYSADEIADVFSVEPYAIQESYLKNILRRFAAFYDRQGQPDIDAACIGIDEIVEDLYSAES